MHTLHNPLALISTNSDTERLHPDLPKLPTRMAMSCCPPAKLGSVFGVLLTRMNPVTLFRPVGESELALIRQSGWMEFPPRLPEQPIFYPVLGEQYAAQIARDWNARDGGNGYVLRFAVDGDYLSRYDIQTVGSRLHREYWIPAEELASFNEHIIPPIEMIAVFQPND
jgi:hypothetical protein